MFTPRILNLAVGLSTYIRTLLPCQRFETSLIKLGTSLG